MGSGTYGVQAASEKYFNKKVEDLNLYECAVIASLLKAPSGITQLLIKLFRRELSLVLENMAKSQMISKAKVKEAKYNNKRYSKFTTPPKSTRYFIDWPLQRSCAYVGEINEDLIVRTTLDVKLQKLLKTTQ